MVLFLHFLHFLHFYDTSKKLGPLDKLKFSQVNIMKRSRRKFDSAFKAKDAIEALKE